jgi:hypothetical protein
MIKTLMKMIRKVITWGVTVRTALPPLGKLVARESFPPPCAAWRDRRKRGVFPLMRAHMRSAARDKNPVPGGPPLMRALFMIREATLLETT